MDLYWGSGSPYAWRVMLGLLFKKMPYEGHQLSLSDREHKAAHYTRLNPRGKVPTLVDGETVVTESIAILAYLDRVYPRHLLFGATPAASARVWQTVMEIENYLHPQLFDVVRALYFGRAGGKEKALRETVGHCFEEIDLLEARCPEGPLNAIDCLWVPLIESCQRASMKSGAGEVGLLPLPLDRWPGLKARLEAVRDLEGYQDTVPPHWR